MAHGKKSCSARPCVHSLGLALGMATHLRFRAGTQSMTRRSAFPCNSSKLMQGQCSRSHCAIFSSVSGPCPPRALCPLKDGYAQPIQQERAAAWQTGLRPTSTEVGQGRGQVGKRTGWPCPVASVVGSRWGISWGQDDQVGHAAHSGWPVLFSPRPIASLKLHNAVYSLHSIFDTMPPAFHLSVLSPSCPTLPGIHIAHISAKGINGFSLKLWERNVLSIKAYHHVLLQ